MKRGETKPLDWKRNLLFVSVAQFFSIAGFGFSLPFVPFYIRDVLGVTVESERSLWVGIFAASGHLALFLGWGTSFRALGWFACAALAGGVAMLGGVRLVFLVTAGLFFLLAPCIFFTARRLTAVMQGSR